MSGPAPAVFFSYSFKDAEWKNRIVAVLKNRGVDVWEDSRLRTGDDWDSEIHQAIDGAHVAVLLITPNYLSSETIQKEQVPYLLQHKKRLYPILIAACEWQQFDWLSSIQIFPSDLLPLADTDDTRLQPRLALAALEISSFAGIAPTPQTVSARLTDSDGRFAGMATLVSPSLALSVMAGTDLGASCSLEFPNLQPATVQATADLVDQSLNLRLLRLNSPLPWQVEVSFSLPGPGAVWECITFPSASSPGVYTTGTVSGLATRDGKQYLHLQPSIEQHEARGMSGAAIVMDGRIVAVLESQGKILDEWFAIPLQVVVASPIGVMIQTAASPQSAAPDSPQPGAAMPPPPNPPQSPASPTPPPHPDPPEPAFDGAAFLARLTDGARASLERAEAYRLALGQSRWHTEHLLLGLYLQPDSPMRRLARDANVFDEQALRRLLSGANPRLLSDLKPASAVTLTSLPPLSNHVRQALIAAQKPGQLAIGRRSLLDGALSLQDCEVVAALRNAIPGGRKGAVSLGPVRQQDWLPEVSTDIPGEKDQDLLNIQRDVGALCSVIAAADAALPLSIGLFGDWGSGKSFFMKEMEQKLTGLAARGAPIYCSSIVQLKFNAWHYMDTTLWASLTSEIFEGLATALSKSPPTDPENKAAALLADMSTSRDKLADAERKKGDAEAELAKSELRLLELQNSATKVSASLSPRVLLTEATRLALEQDEVKKELSKAAKELNLPQAETAGAEVNKELMELRGIGSAMLLAMRNTERLWLWIVALALVVAALFGLPPLVRLLLPHELQSVRDLIAGIAAVLGSLAALLGPFLLPARRALRYLQDARKKSDDIVQQKQKEKRKDLEAERDLRQHALDAQSKNVEEARAKVEQLELAIQNLRADRQMLDFIKQRNLSTDYTSHLGVIARAYKDFRELSAFLERVAKEPAQPNLPRVERIVLYIDDLDRCPEDKVMDVLQAVHLLLAFPLFVVVVGVDPRWLLHSVAERSPALRRDSAASRDLWQSTPLNYLEKIFQIPFTLSPMTSVGFGQLVEKVAGVKDGAQREHLVNRPRERVGGLAR